MKRSSRGNALLLVTVLLIVLLGLVGAYMAVTSHHHLTAARAREAELAFTIAESGIDDAINELNAQRDYGGDGLGAVSGPLGRGSYRVEIDPPYSGPRRYALRSTGEYGDAARGIVAIVAPEGYGADKFATALFGDLLVNIHINAAVDSYDSRDGAYDVKRTNRFRNQAYAGAKAHVKSNHGISIGSNAKVFGDVTAGPRGSTELVANAHVSGVSTRAVIGENLPPVEVPVLPNQGDAVVAAGKTLLVPSGGSRYASIVVEAGGTLKIQGPATLVVDRFVVGPSGKIVIEGRNGTVTIYGTGMFRLDPTAEWVSAAKNPSELALRISTDNFANPNQPVEVDGVGRFYGTIYAPNADLTLDTPMEIFGAVSAKAVKLGAGVEVHYDEALAPAPSAPVFRLLSWEEKPAKKGKSGKN